MNPALEQLAPLIGEWDMLLSNAGFLPDPQAVVHGRASCEWIEEGAFLVMRQGKEATWLVGRDENTEDYTVLYFDARGVSRVYEMTFTNDVWKMWRDAPGFSQRYEGRVSKDKTTIVAQWEKSMDGKTWEHDFDMRYTKLK